MCVSHVPVDALQMTGSQHADIFESHVRLLGGGGGEMPRGEMPQNRFRDEPSKTSPTNISTPSDQPYWLVGLSVCLSVCLSEEAGEMHDFVCMPGCFSIIFYIIFPFHCIISTRDGGNRLTILNLFEMTSQGNWTCTN